MSTFDKVSHQNILFYLSFCFYIYVQSFTCLLNVAPYGPPWKTLIRPGGQDRAQQ